MYVRALALGCFYSHISTQALHTQVAAFTGEKAGGKKDEASKRQQKENIKSQKLNSLKYSGIIFLKCKMFFLKTILETLGSTWHVNCNCSNVALVTVRFRIQPNPKFYSNFLNFYSDFVSLILTTWDQLQSCRML